MSIIKQEFKLNTPLPEIFLDGWTMKNMDFVSFRNLDHFKYIVNKLKQKRDNTCDMTYAKALDMLMRHETDFSVKKQQLIRDTVRKNLHKRGCVTDEVYEAFKYTTDGTNLGVDIGKYASGEPDCVMTPQRQYVDFFYELYINISYCSSISNETIRDNVAKLLATVEELERRHIFIKITMIFPARHVTLADGGRNFFSAIPLFSHKDYKSVEVMSAVVNDRLLRKFYFAVLENTYGSNLASTYGQATELEGSMSIGTTFNEVQFYESIVKEVEAGET